MKDIFYKKIALILLIILQGYYVNAQEKLSKSIEKTYDFTNSGTLQLENKYGNITIDGWDQNKVQIIIDISVSKKEKNDAQELLDRIQPSINQTNGFIKIVSDIKEKSESFFSKVFNSVNPFDFDKGNVQIDYKISLPTNAEIQLTNKFGDIIISDWDGKLTSDLQHGDMWINNDLVNANIKMKFGKLQTKSITYGKIELKNSEFDHQTSKNLRVLSNGSTITIEKVNTLELYSNKDKVDLGSVEKIKGELKFSNVFLDNLINDIDLFLDVADLKVDKITNTAANIDINQKSSEININISDLNFDFEASLEQGLLRIPKTFTHIKNKMIDTKKRLREIQATYGSNQDKGTFRIKGRKGVIILKEY
ncbi:hypothetical protein [Aquimarina litoralis]|uniref:hypothetical protein n=1 Tax=Aquimarina litoralis TaxID=584605 RepID=UPI001C58D5FB|nr:hypothetical protein [Aquimarina litoralis]MBW1298177.1 hypothetical protein [Aquimarina litoralis]